MACNKELSSGLVSDQCGRSSAPSATHRPLPGSEVAPKSTISGVTWHSSKLLPKQSLLKTLRKEKGPQLRLTMVLLRSMGKQGPQPYPVMLMLLAQRQAVHVAMMARRHNCRARQDKEQNACRGRGWFLRFLARKCQKPCVCFAPAFTPQNPRNLRPRSAILVRTLLFLKSAHTAQIHTDTSVPPSPPPAPRQDQQFRHSCPD